MPLIRPTYTFNTYSRADYIGAGILAAEEMRHLIADERRVTCCIAGPTACGKSLFMDAIIHHLADDLNADQTPESDHMMLESKPDEALTFNRVAYFPINGMKRRIAFKNLGHFDTPSPDEISHICKKYMAHLQFFSFTGSWGSAPLDSFFPSTTIDMMYHIGTGHGLNRSWNMWRDISLSKIHIT